MFLSLLLCICLLSPRGFVEVKFVSSLLLGRWTLDGVLVTFCGQGLLWLVGTFCGPLGESAWLPPCMVLVINDNPYGLMFTLRYSYRSCP